MKTPKLKVERKTVFYLLIAAGLFYNLFLAFSDPEPHEQRQLTKHEISNSPNLK
ncbi:MAG: hypothetical protein Q8S14_18350 [Algoriphagus sp.]|uniref:hypothetical protein n=1 Tax=Algoriphagus sp. TaxID=1872435 RepID=UPI00271B612F|nr:hypothetical protein [Algoriphagus sp.]MDO8965782.1 hypothetical protein [Algoriphagus sp.]MDP2042486.1 hypothetical protein [Algoriphagus sp.]MDP3198877.1 hypothetical protein [Algoriphagus sp.]MDP3473836.1 hypothetical protein [Algoriphagus sp.]